jgi:hypothetical protein
MGSGSPRTFVAQSAVLSGGIFMLVAIVAPVAYSFGGVRGALDSVMAAVVCLCGATSGIMFRCLLTGPVLAVHGILLGMAARMGVPLAAALLYCFRPGALGNPQFLYYLLVFYMLTLAIDTVVALSGTDEGSATKAKSRSA